MSEKLSNPEHKTIEYPPQEGANKMNSELTIQNLTDNLSHPQIEPEMEAESGVFREGGYATHTGIRNESAQLFKRRVCDKVNQQQAENKSSQQKPVTQQKPDLAQLGAEVKAKFIENQARFAESRAKFLSTRSKYSRAT